MLFARGGAIVCICAPPMRGCQTAEPCTSLTCQRRNVWPRKATVFSCCNEVAGERNPDFVPGEDGWSMSVQTASYVAAIDHLPKGATLRIPAVRWEDYEQ